MRAELALALALLGGCFGDEVCLRESDCAIAAELPDAQELDAPPPDAPPPDAPPPDAPPPDAPPPDAPPPDAAPVPELPADLGPDLMTP